MMKIIDMRWLLFLVLLTGCVRVQVTGTPTPASVTPVPVTPEITPEVTVDPTPTLETDCVPHYWAVVWGYTNLYANPELTVRLFEDGQEVVLKPGRAVLLLESRVDDARQTWAYRVVTADGARVEGWIPFYVLPVDCQ